MNINELEQLIHGDITKRFQEYEDSQVPPEPVPEPSVIVKAGENLQTALDIGGVIHLEQEADFSQVGGYNLKSDGTTLKGLEDNTVMGSRGPALRCGMNFHSAVIESLELRSDYDQSLLRFGINGTEQNTVTQVPRDFKLIGLKIPEYRGKHAIELNAADVLIENCEVRDVYAPSGQDSQAIYIANTSGSITIRDCHLEAASENIIAGGDKIKLTDARPTNIIIENCTLTKPLGWKNVGTPKVKTLFELKDGWDVLIRNCSLTNSWVSGQDGYGFTFTPSQGGRVKVRAENCNMSNVSSICNITGQDQNGYYPNEPRTQVHILGGSYQTNKAANGGRGIFALITHGPESVIVQDADIVIDGSSFILIGDQKPIDKLHVLNCKWNYGLYGIFIAGYAHGDNRLGVIKEIKVQNCTIVGAHSAFKARYPDNVYVNVMTTAREREIDET